MPKVGMCQNCRVGYVVQKSIIDTVKMQQFTPEVKNSTLTVLPKPEFSVFEHNKKRIQFYRDVLEEVERQNEILEGQLMFNDLLDRELKRRNDG
jgi:CCR4-NOT transcriptional regulation complex NOT5 subunit